MEDNKIIELFLQRSEEAIHELDKKYGAKCAKIAGSIIPDEEDAKECVNDVYMSIWNAIPPECPQKLLPYLCKITRNLACKRIRYNNAIKRSCKHMIPLSEFEECIPYDCNIDNELNMKCLIKEIDTFLEQYSIEERNIFIKYHYHFDTYEQIAQAYGYKETSIKVRLHRMKRKLKEFLIKRGYEIT